MRTHEGLGLLELDVATFNNAALAEEPAATAESRLTYYTPGSLGHCALLVGSEGAPGDNPMIVYGTTEAMQGLSPVGTPLVVHPAIPNASLGPRESWTIGYSGGEATLVVVDSSTNRMAANFVLGGAVVLELDGEAINTATDKGVEVDIKDIVSQQKDVPGHMTVTGGMDAIAQLIESRFPIELAEEPMTAYHRGLRRQELLQLLPPELQELTLDRIHQHLLGRHRIREYTNRR